MIRKANIKDVKTIYGLLHYYGKKGELLPRPLSELYDHLRNFSVKVFALTYLPKFFERYDFVKIPRSELPLKIWGDCLLCVKFPDCDEIAMMKEL